MDQVDWFMNVDARRLTIYALICILRGDSAQRRPRVCVMSGGVGFWGSDDVAGKDLSL